MGLGTFYVSKDEMVDLFTTGDTFYTLPYTHTHRELANAWGNILILSHILITNYDDAVESKQTNLGLGMDYVAKILMANKVDTF